MKSPLPTVAAVVREQTGVAWSRARKLRAEGRVTVNGERCLDPASRIAADAVVVVDELAPKHRTGPLVESAILFFDRDKDTSGLMVFARTAVAQRLLASQFRAHDVDRVYQAIVHGVVAARHVETHLIPDRGDGLRGSYGHFRRPRGDPPSDAKRAVTLITPIARLEGATQVECRLETGRQHQIRIHLSELGHPLVGERVYIRDYHGVKIESPRPMLHAQSLGFVHPGTAKRVLFQREAPADFQAMLERLQPDAGR